MKKGLDLEYTEGAPLWYDQLGGWMQIIGTRLVHQTGWPLDHDYIAG